LAWWQLQHLGLLKQVYVTEEMMTSPEVNEWLHEVTDELMCIADAFTVTTVLERRGDSINVRQRDAVRDLWARLPGASCLRAAGRTHP
jgi:hypothetical protein